ncbi:MAG: DUF58 domain-containing protein [Pseudomonadota bacterium]
MSSIEWRFPKALTPNFGGRLSRWVRRRQGREQLPVELKSKRLYILPTSVGLTYAIVCFAMLLGSMNYNNSMGFALTFLLAATGLVAMHRCHQNLAGLTVTQLHGGRVFAGGTLPITVTLSNGARTPRFDIESKIGTHKSSIEDVPKSGTLRVRIPVATARRGLLKIERLGLQTTFPLGLLQTWAWLYLDAECIVWPKPADEAPPRPLTASTVAGERGGGGDEDFAGLRDYQTGDSPRLIAWKTLARTGELHSRQFEGQNAARAWLDLSSLDGMDLEPALSVMTRWVLDAERDGDEYGLRLPGIELPPGHGHSHRDHCLDALARYRAPEADHVR